MGAVTKRRATKNEAKIRADGIRHHAETLWGLLLQAWDHEDHIALGYESWKDYMVAEFEVTTRQAYYLLDQARVTVAIQEQTGRSEGVKLFHSEDGQPAKLVSIREAQVLKHDAPKAAREIAKAVERGKPVQEAVQAAVAKRAPVARSRPHDNEPGLPMALVRPNGAAPAELLALLALDPTASGKHAGRPALASVRQARLWLDRFEGAIKGAQPIVTQAQCLHPTTRRIGQGCAACGKDKV